jgi:hypothetical protein
LFGGRGLNKIFFEKGVLGGAESITKYSWANEPHVTKGGALADSLKKVIMFHQKKILISFALNSNLFSY